MDARATIGAVSPPLVRDFSLVLGGPLFQLLRRARLEDDAGELLRRRIVAFVVITWLPLLVLTMLDGTAWGTGVAVPFLREVTVHTRFLVALPLLVLAELVVHLRLRAVVAQFSERDMVPPEAMPRFTGAIDSAMRLRNSIPAEVILIAVVYVVGIGLVWPRLIALSTPTWYAPAAAGGAAAGLSAAGWWLLAVSLPVFQFMLVRWYFRLFIWARFLWQISRIRLALLPTHPDGVAGLAFLGQVAHVMAPLAAAHGALVAGVVADAIFYSGARLTDFKVELFMLVVFMLMLVVGPLLAFTPQLAAVKRAGNREYGTLAQNYARAFDQKWMRGGAQPDEPLLGSGDIQSLADLGNATGVIRSMQVVPFTRQALVQLTLATLLPVAPLVLTMMPFDDLLKLLLGVVV